MGKYEQLSINFSTDGVAGYSKLGWFIYPLWISVNELPPGERFKEHNCFLVGLWFSRNPVQMNLFLKPFVKELQELQKGRKITDFFGSRITYTVVLICGVYDTPGRSFVLNHKHHNGYFGSTFCLHPCNRETGIKKNLQIII